MYCRGMAPRAIERDNETWMGLLFWAGIGAAIGYVAAERRGFPMATGLVLGLALGPLAVGLFLVPVASSDTGHQHTCPYCGGRVASTARVCTHCSAILTDG